MPKVIFNGEAGDAYTNETEKVQYQFVASLVNTCGTCLQYHLAVSSYWPIPLHRGCRCRQTLVAPGATAEPWVDFRKMLDEMSAGQRREAVGASNYRLLKRGVVQWDDVVTNTRVRSFREVVARKRLTVPDLKSLGINERIARAAYDSTHTTGHQAAALHRKALVEQLNRAGVSTQQVRESFARGVASKVVLVKPHGPASPGSGVVPKPIEPLIPRLGLDAKKVKAAVAKPAPKPIKTPQDAADLVRSLGVDVTVLNSTQAKAKYGEKEYKSIPASYSPTFDEISINAAAEAWKDPGRLAKSKADGVLSTGNYEGVVHHEVGHHKHRNALGAKEFVELSKRVLPDDLVDLIEKHVSGYAATNQVEFVAEAYALIQAGGRIPKVLMDFYASLKGPTP